MKISKIKFVFIFLACAFTFIIGTGALLDQQPEVLFGSASQLAWQSFLSIVLSPVKVILMGPLLPFIKFLHQDPDTPPPFFLIGFAFYWTLLALFIHYVIGKINGAYKA
jgi:hypothetical protein